jgi:predicted dehydrogenase
MMLKAVLIGAGDRGRIYGEGILKRGGEIVAVADPRIDRLSDAGKALHVPAKRLYQKDEDLFACGKIADFAIIATLDETHYEPAMAALDLGYDLLLEKPISNKMEEILAIGAKAKQLNRQVVVCHVLRYSPFFSMIKSIVDSGAIGPIVDIQHNENIGNFHFAHSYVRGNWNNAEQTSPLILAKSCHDLDFLLWVTGKNVTAVSSFGSLSYFRPENAPKGASERCVNCPFKEQCRYSAYRVYLPMKGSWPATVLTSEQTEAGLTKAIEQGPYGRCVFHCDNDVVDHQVTVLQFENGVTATFNLSAFTDRVSRTLKIMGENGEIRGNEIDNVIEVIPFGSTPTDQRSAQVYHPALVSGGHNGSDNRFIDDFMQVFAHQKKSDTALDVSLDSHLIAFAIEASREEECQISLADFRKRF